MIAPRLRDLIIPDLVEDVAEGLPEFDTVAALALVVEAVDPADRRRFVVAPQEKEVLREFDLVREEQADGLQAPLAPIDVVSQEEVVGVRRVAAVVKDPQQVVVLAVDIAAKAQRRL